MRPTLLVCALALTVALLAPKALAQPCAPLPTGVFVEWSACNNGPRVNWALPSGQLIFPLVYRSLTTNFADAVLVVQASLNQPSASDDGAPANTDLYYWVQFQGLNTACQFSGVTGPVLGRRISLGSTTFVVPPPTISVQCDGVTLEWPRIRENLNSGLLLRRFSVNPNTQIDIPLPPNSTTFRDTSGTPGEVYGYTVFFQNTCRGTEGTEAGTARFPPFASQPQPRGEEALVGTFTSITVDYGVASPAVTTVNWFKLPNVTLMQTDGRIVVSGRFLSFNPVRESDAGLYVAVPGTNCIVPQQTQVGLIVKKRCPADFNASGLVTVQDVFDFLEAFFSTCP
jgi:hypothetical protein